MIPRKRGNMIQSEKDLEDYICNNQEEFINELKKIYGEDEDIKFLGRQVHIGESNIADLIYYFDNLEKDKEGTILMDIRNYIIVELKFRLLEPKDLAQLSRYMTTLEDKLYNEEKYMSYETFINGLFVSLGEDHSMQEIMIKLKETDCNIEFLSIKSNITFNRDNWSHNEEYIEKLKLDNRIEELYKEE